MSKVRVEKVTDAEVVQLARQLLLLYGRLCDKLFSELRDEFERHGGPAPFVYYTVPPLDRSSAVRHAARLLERAVRRAERGKCWHWNLCTWCRPVPEARLVIQYCGIDCIDYAVIDAYLL